MSTRHEVTVKPIDEVAKFMKNLIPVNIPEAYTLKPRLESLASGERIRNAVVAFKDFMYLFFDRLITDGHLYAKPPKKPSSMTDYPFLSNVACLLVEMGYYSKLADSGESLLITEMPSCNAYIDENGKRKGPNISGVNTMECLRFLSLCGFAFNGIDFEAKTVVISQAQPLEVTYPNHPVMLTGLKAMAIADKELRKRRGWNDNSILRCDYRLLKEEDTDTSDVLKDFLHPLPEQIQAFALKLHHRYTSMGMTCSIRVLGDINFAYADVRKSRRDLSPTDIYSLSIWQVSISMKKGYSLFIRPKKTDKYKDIIEKFPSHLREKIEKSYGCDRKRNERCQGGCQGIRIPLDELILDIGGDIETWLDSEMSLS
ncbi:MAG: hypothetical protein FWD90_07470 [Defluviitaleaceae bacterium]|nr:hypothetical protein [Defluviitaleaceae bacterium]